MLAAIDQSGNTPAHWATKGNKINILRFIAQVLSPFLYAFDVSMSRDGLSDSIADGLPEHYNTKTLLYLTCRVLSVLHGHAFTQRKPELLVASNRLNQTPSDVAWSPDSSTFLLSAAKGLAQ